MIYSFAIDLDSHLDLGVQMGALGNKELAFNPYKTLCIEKHVLRLLFYRTYLMKKSLVNLAVVANLSFILSACGSSGSSGNQAPVFNQSTFTYELLEDQSMQGEVAATDADGDQLAYSVGKSADNGVITVNRDGSFIYTPVANFFGEDTATIVVSDSIASATISLSFQVTNVNDLPVISTSQVVVSSTGQTKGQVTAQDLDGDTLTFSIVQAPSVGKLFLDSETGHFTYDAEALNEVKGSFIVSVSDGNAEPVEAEVSLSPSFVTNQDKLGYYYASDVSHLSKAKQLVELNQTDDPVAIKNALLSEQAYAEIALGYAQSGFADEAIKLVSNQIAGRKVKAQAYKAIAVAFDKQGQIELANQQRHHATVEYNTYLAELGLENIGSSDAHFYFQVIRDYLNVEQNDLATELLKNTNLYANSLIALDEESKSAHRAFVTAHQTHSQNMVEDFVNDEPNVNFDKTYNAIKAFSDITSTVSYQETSRGIYHQYRANFFRQAAQLAHILSLKSSGTDKEKALQLAKYNLAQGLALYSDINYDSQYALKAEEYAANTLARFDTPLQLFSGLFESLYPEYIAAHKSEDNSGNVAYELLKSVGSSTDLKMGHRHLYAHKLLTDALSGRPMTETLANISSTFSGGDEAEIFHTLVEAGTVNFAERYGAWLLHYAGLDEQALTLVSEAEKLIQTEAYLTDVRFVVDQVLESDGCMRLAELNHVFGGNSEQSNSVVTTCDTLAKTYYQGSETISADKQVQAFNALSVAWAREQQSEKALAASATAQEVALTFSAVDDFIEEHFAVANAQASNGFLTQSLATTQKAFSKFSQAMDETVTVEEKVELIEDTLSQLESLTEREVNIKYLAVNNLQFGVQHHAGLNDDYAQVVTETKALIEGMLDELANATSALSDKDKQDIYKDISVQYAAINAYDKAVSLVLDPVYTEADKELLLLDIVKLQATQDDLPATAVANVDTDKDGLVNFFLPDASEQQITASNLKMDEDSDNDGLSDLEDLSPLKAD